MVFAGGGTGGHVYPSIAVARALQARAQSEGALLETLYIGVRGRVDETIVPREGFEFRAIGAGQLRVASPLTFVRNGLRLTRGTTQALSILRSFKPDAVFATGGYASVPVGIAARVLRRPLVVYLPDVTPGWAVRLLARLATAIATTSEAARAHLPAKKTRVVGYPVREDFWHIDRDAARAKLNIAADAKVLLVTAGSLGARRINEAIFHALPRLLESCEIVHITGEGDADIARGHRSRLATDQQRRYRVYHYLDDMPAAMAAADLAISRAGASTLGELPAAGLAAILVPGEYEGWSQAPNAEYLQSEGAALMLRNIELSRLAETAMELLRDEAQRAQMREAMRRLARPDAARDAAAIVWEAAA